MPMRAERANIVTLEVDAIVNAANSRLLPGSGVCGAIHRAAGPELAAACERIYKCPTGEARLTPGFRLKARHVIHAVGPVWHGGNKGEPEALANCYRNSLALLRKAGGSSIAFPAISTGTYGYPLDQAALIAVRTVRDDLATQGDAEVVFACFDAATLALYEKELAA